MCVLCNLTWGRGSGRCCPVCRRRAACRGRGRRGRGRKSGCRARCWWGTAAGPAKLISSDQGHRQQDNIKILLSPKWHQRYIDGMNDIWCRKAPPFKDQLMLVSKEFHRFMDLCVPNCQQMFYVQASLFQVKTIWLNLHFTRQKVPAPNTEVWPCCTWSRRGWWGPSRRGPRCRRRSTTRSSWPPRPPPGDTPPPASLASCSGIHVIPRPYRTIFWI